MGRAIALILALCGLFALGTPSRALGRAVGAWHPRGSCPNILVIGARGTAQDLAGDKFTDRTRTLGLGEEVFGFYQQLGAAVGSSTVAELANPYPAIRLERYLKYDIFRSIDEGKMDTRVLVALVTKQCAPRTRIVLAGYSQGAWVMKESVSFLQDQSAVAALALLADPTFDPKSAGVIVGKPNPRKGGIASPYPLPGWIAARTVSACVPHDLVCQSNNGPDVTKNLIARGWRIHTERYKDPGLQRALARIVAGFLYPSASFPMTPPCTKRALMTGLRYGFHPELNGQLTRPWGCAGRFAYAGVDVSIGGNLNTITELFRVAGGHWATADRAKYCSEGAVPRRIYANACETN